jgi:hypothetical protein
MIKDDFIQRYIESIGPFRSPVIDISSSYNSSRKEAKQQQNYRGEEENKSDLRKKMPGFPACQNLCHEMASSSPELSSIL